MEGFAADIAKSLLGKLGSFTVTEISKAWGLGADRARLDENLLAINAVLMDAERQQSQNEKIRFWLQKLREFMYDAVEALDEFGGEDLRRQVVKTSGSTGRKLRRFFSSSIKLALRFKMGPKINDLDYRQAEIESMKSKFDLTNQASDHSAVFPKRKHFSHLSFRLFMFYKVTSNASITKTVSQASADSSQTFSIVDCPNIIELPEFIGNLKKLLRLVIRMCPGLRERCQGNRRRLAQDCSCPSNC